MDRKGYKHTIVAMIAIHFVLSVFMALACGTNHPFNNMYIPGKPYAYVIASCLLAIPLYMCMGFLYILGKNYLKGMKKCLFYCSFSFFVILLIGYVICYVLTKYTVIKGSFMYYVIMNYPTGIIFNSISLAKDALNLAFILTTIPGPLGFYIGGVTRLRYEIATNKRGE